VPAMVYPHSELAVSTVVQTVAEVGVQAPSQLVSGMVAPVPLVITILLFS